MENNNKSITIQEHYLYYPEYNTIINKELSETFNQYSGDKNFTDIDIDKNIIKQNIKNIQQVVFEITQDCNLRCKYCIYSGEYFHYRKASKKHLSYEIAERGLLYIHELIKNRMKREFTLGFFGGEPLLKFDLIKKIVMLSKILFAGWNVSFNITTNGTEYVVKKLLIT